MNKLSDAERVREMLAQLNLQGEVVDALDFVHVKLAGGREFEISHNFMKIINKKGLETRVRYGAGIEKGDA